MKKEKKYKCKFLNFFFENQNLKEKKHELNIVEVKIEKRLSDRDGSVTKGEMREKEMEPPLNIGKHKRKGKVF